MSPATTPAWNPHVAEIPVDTPVLVRQRGEPVPFMAVRDAEFEPQAVSYLLGPTRSAYGVYVEIDELEAWLSVS